MIEYHPNLLTKDEVDFLVAAPKTQDKDYGIGLTGKRNIFFVDRSHFPDAIPDRAGIFHAMVNIYNQPYVLPYHNDNSGINNIKKVMVVCLATERGESLQFKKFALDKTDRSTDCGVSPASKNLDTYDLIFPLNPGDAVSWTREDEEEGWMHGGNFNGNRMSMVVRYAA